MSPTESRSTRPSSRAAFTAWSLAALLAGLLIGALAHRSGDPLAARLVEAIVPVGEFWVSALSLMVVPLVITQMLAAVTVPRGHAEVGALGLRAVGLFVAMLVAGGLFTLIVTPPLVNLYPVDPATVAALRTGTPIPQAAARMVGTGADTFGAWLVGLVPHSIPAALSGTEILPVLLCTILFGLAVLRLPPALRDQLTPLFDALARTMMIIVGWILVITPLGVFALALQLTAHVGGQMAGLLLVFVLISCGVMLAFTLLLYPVSAVFGRVSLRRFARAVAPAQVVALATRSSIASLPSMIEGAREELRLPGAATGFVLPLSVSAFKVNRTVSSTVKVLFLTHLFQVPLSPVQFLTFLITVILLSFSTVGIPGGSGGFSTLPAYLAIGIPIEGVVILQAVDTIPDLMKTVTNVTGDMSAAVILTRPLPEPEG